ncbi:MAG: DNA polymerase III subunit delta [SAR324 cluster bacterium]|nr:DNA polymerase III subunit delta [SAR324 cluster bacterium]
MTISKHTLCPDMLPILHLIYGNQQLLVDETTENLTKQLLEQRDRQDALERFDAIELLKDNSQGVTLDQFQTSCETLPFLTDLKVIRLDHCEVLATSAKPGNGKEGRLLHVLLNSIRSPHPAFRYLLTSSAMSDKNLNSLLLKEVKKNGKVIKFVAYEDSTPVDWLLKRASQKNLPLSRGMAELLIELVGNDLNDLDQEMEKLSLMNISRSTLTEQFLLDHVQGYKHFSVFRIIQALSLKQIVPALETLEQVMMESAKDYVKLFVLIHQQFRKLLMIHYLKRRQAPEDEILGSLGMHPFLGRQVVAQARNFKTHELEQIYHRLGTMDLPFKYHPHLAQTMLQDLFQSICLSS